MDRLLDSSIKKNSNNSTENIVNLESPSIPHLQLKRSKIFEKLENNLNRKLVLVQAPAGFGKTSLLLQYHQWSKTQAIENYWLTVDSTMNDLNRFVQIFTNMIDKKNLFEKKSYTGIIEFLINNKRPFKIFFDDFEKIQNPAVVQFIDQILLNLPEHGELIIGSRNIPNLNLGKIRVHRQLLEINHDDLRLDLDEISTIFNNIYRYDLRSEEINLILKNTSGWPAAIALISLALPRQKNIKDFLLSFSGKNAELADFIIEEILDTMDEDDKKFMLEISVLHEIDAEVCDWICKRTDSSVKLASLYKRNFFLIATDEEKNKYKLHSLFKSFLNNYLNTSNTININTLHNCAAQWYLKNNRPIKAIDHLIENEDQTEAIVLINTHARDQLISGRIRRLLKWFEKLKPQFKKSIEGTQLHLIYAWALTLNRHLDEASTEISKFIDVRGDNISNIDSQEAQTINCLILSMTDQIVECHKVTTDLLRDLDPSLYLEHGVLSSIVAYCMIASNKYDAARQLMSEAMIRNGRLKLSFIKPLSDSHDGMIDIIQGRLGHALTNLESSYEMLWASSSKSLPGGKANIGVPLAEVLYEIGEIDRSNEILADTLAYTRENGTPDVIIAGYIIQARIHNYHGDSGSALRVLKDLENLAIDYNLERAECTAKIERAKTLFLNGDYASVRKLYNEIKAYKFWYDTKDYLFPTLESNDAEMMRWRLEMSAGNSYSIISELKKNIKISLSTKRMQRALKLNILLSLAYFSDNKTNKALEKLTEILLVASKQNYMRIILDEGASIQILLKIWLNKSEYYNKYNEISKYYLDKLSADFENNEILLSKSFFKLNDEQIKYLENSLEKNDVNDSIETSISRREKEVLVHLSEGYPNKVIAEKMFVSETTVKAHLRNIHVKLGAKNRTEAVAIARKYGVI